MAQTCWAAAVAGIGTDNCIALFMINPKSLYISRSGNVAGYAFVLAFSSFDL